MNRELFVSIVKFMQQQDKNGFWVEALETDELNTDDKLKGFKLEMYIVLNEWASGGGLPQRAFAYIDALGQDIKHMNYL